MELNKKLIRDAFAELFIEMFNNNTDNVELTFDFAKCIVKFDVVLTDLKEKIENEKKVNK